jgi:hypothetical protein
MQIENHVVLTESSCDTEPLQCNNNNSPSPLPQQITFDYWTHEYWRLGQMYRDLALWQTDLERWEQDLSIRSRSNYGRARNFTRRFNRNRPREQSQI